MALTTVASGTLTLSATTETNLEAARAPSVATSYVYEVDLGAAAAGEVFFFRAYTVVLASGTERLAYFGSFVGGTDIDKINYTVPIPVSTGTSITIRASLQRKNGSSRDVPWALYSL